MFRFLWWNTNPAKIILGDVGSHFIGSIIVLLLISISAEGLTLLICMIFIVEALSVVLQIVSYKLRKKRIFKMAPIHHHFEMCGWAETTVIVRFWILNGIFVILALGLFMPIGFCTVIKVCLFLYLVMELLENQ